MAIACGLEYNTGNTGSETMQGRRSGAFQVSLPRKVGSGQLHGGVTV